MTEPETIDKIIAEMVHRPVNEVIFIRSFNPMEMYCRMIDCGIKKEVALQIAANYEQLIYHRIRDYLKHKEG